MHNIAIFPVRANDGFASKLAESLRELGAYDESNLRDRLVNRKFGDGEYNPIITEDNVNDPDKKRCEGKKVYIVWSITSQITPTDSFGRVLLLTDDAYREGAEEVNLVIPYHRFNRQDIDPSEIYTRKFDMSKEEDVKLKAKLEKTRGEPFSLEVIIKHLHYAGIKNILTMDDHSEHTGEIYERIYGGTDSYINLDSLPIYAHYILNSLSKEIDLGNEGENIVLLGPDENSWSKINKMYELLNLKKVTKLLFDKNRLEEDNPNMIDTVLKECDCDLSDLSKKIVFGFDDIGSSLGTFTNPIVQLFGKERPKYVFGFIPHLILTGPEAYSKVYDNRLNLVGTNSHPNLIHHDEMGMSQITVLDVTKYFAMAMISCIEKSKQPSSVFDFSPVNLEEAGLLYKTKKGVSELIPYKK